jgi:hypothetical protein
MPQPVYFPLVRKYLRQSPSTPLQLSKKLLEKTGQFREPLAIFFGK